MLHKDIYIIGAKLPKRDKLGIHSKIENYCVEILALAIKASLQPTNLKLESLKSLRIKIEVIKNLIRTENKIDIIKEKTYLHISKQLVEISKMANGWIKYVTQKGA